MDILVGNDGGNGVTIKIEYINKPPDVDIIELAFLTSFEYDDDFIFLDEPTREWLWPDVSDFDSFIDEHYEFGGDFSDENPMINYIEPDIHSWLIYYQSDGPEGLESLILRAYYKDINNMDSFIFEEGIEYKIVVDLTQHLVVSIEPNQNDDVTRFHNVYATINDSNDYYGLLYNNIDERAYSVDTSGDSLNLTDIFMTYSND
jgi:hypothetical protein